MTAKRDDCRSIENLIHLSLDGRLGGDGKRRLEEHLASCGRCARKLAALRETEERARKLEPAEPPVEYWSAFSRRVIERIEGSAGEKPARSPMRALADLFAAPRPRLRLAAAVASLAIVVAAGALYVRHQGRIVPSAPTAYETQAPRGKHAPPGDEVATAEPDAEPEVPPKTEETAPPERKPSVEPTVEPVIEPAVSPAASPEAKPAVQSAPAMTPQPESAPPAEPKSEVKTGTLLADELAKREGEIKSLAETVAAQVQPPAATEPARAVPAEPKGAVSVASVTAGDTVGREKAAAPLARAATMFSRATKDRSVDARLAKGESQQAAPRGSFVLDRTTVPRISAADTAMTEAGLRGVIRGWRGHIERNPLDPTNDEGFLQVATAYELLARLTRDEAVISEGAQAVQGYADRADDAALKTLLFMSKARIESFRGK